MAERGVRLIDAPVSGSVSGAEAGTLAVMIGADAATVAPYEPILGAIGTSLFSLGEVGRGNILNNYVALSNQAALCGAMALADRLGIPRQTVGEVLGKNSGASFILERKLGAMVEHDYKAGFFVELGWKDLGLGLELAAATGAKAAVGRKAWKLDGQAREAGWGKLATSGLLGLLEPKP
jgi:3-hydroxyisobutyrate dehydrogenase-like beta-hydroxyacid dehydrogenase